MVINSPEIQTVVHGMLFGFIFLLGFGGALYAVSNMTAEWLTTEGIVKTINNIKVSGWTLAVSAWAAVITRAYDVCTLGIAQPYLAGRPISHLPQGPVAGQPQHRGMA